MSEARSACGGLPPMARPCPQAWLTIPPAAPVDAWRSGPAAAGMAAR